ncbi:MAG: Unknown protein [uncultured Thiotrichaceae bacterium]|uniref:EAL domain-containing protein n=1 Tax=uncultured Thiotrichaceae bacterium TaxID=298394 RepID=A0A6S6S951_9GAMM|nr:MAG: Unknown protein [uncultured Thiotrichaceae bacterium]
MNKNKVNCLIITNYNVDMLVSHLSESAATAVVETIPGDFPSVIKQLSKLPYHLLFLPDPNSNQHLEKIKKILRRHNKDCIIAIRSNSHQAIVQDSSGIEILAIRFDQKPALPIANLIHYSLLKKQFRQCKRSLWMSEKRNRMLVEMSHEPIAHINRSTHILANSAYISLFEFQSKAELVATDFFELVPKKTHTMLRRYFNKTHMDMQKNLVLTLLKYNKEPFRAGLRVAPTVIQNQRCLQVWIHPLNSRTINTSTSSSNSKPFPAISNPARKHLHLHAKKKTTTLSAKTLLQLPKTRKEIRLKLHKLEDIGNNNSSVFLAKLHIEQNLKNTLHNTNVKYRTSFWDEVTLRLLLSTDQKNTQHHHQVLLKVQTGLLTDPTFRKWFAQRRKIMDTSSNTLHLLFPASCLDEHFKHLLHFQESFRMLNVTVSLVDFIASEATLRQLKHLQPRFISFSNKWLTSLKTAPNARQKVRKLIHKLEENHIQVILPVD